MSRKRTFSQRYVMATMATLITLGITGAALAHEDERLDAQEAAAATAATVRLGDAIRTVEAQTGGTAVEAAYDNENGRVQMEVVLLAKDGSEQVATVDATSGKMISVGTAEDEHPGRGDSGEDREQEGGHED